MAGTGAAVVVERLKLGFVVGVWLGVEAELWLRRALGLGLGLGSAFGRKVPGLG